MAASNVRELIQAIDASVRWGTPLRPQTLMSIRRLLTLLEDGDDIGQRRLPDEAPQHPSHPNR